MAAGGGCFSISGFSTAGRSCETLSFSSHQFKPNHRNPVLPNPARRRFAAVSTEQHHQVTDETTMNNPYLLEVEKEAGAVVEDGRKGLKDYFAEAIDLIRSDGGPPRWFSPLECGSRLDNCGSKSSCHPNKLRMLWPE